MPELERRLLADGGYRTTTAKAGTSTAATSWSGGHMGDVANYINFFHTASHRATACCPRWAAAEMAWGETFGTEVE